MSRQPRLFEPEVPIPEELREAVDLWLAYQREQWRFTYKPLGFAQLLERMAEMGPERAMAAVKWSMGGSGHPYKGLFEPPAKNGNGQARGGPPERYQPWMSEGTIAQWPYLDRSEQRQIIENITMGVERRRR